MDLRGRGIKCDWVHYMKSKYYFVHVGEGDLHSFIPLHRHADLPKLVEDDAFSSMYISVFCPISGSYFGSPSSMNLCLSCGSVLQLETSVVILLCSYS